MSTFLPKADEITRNWYVIDAAGKPLGRVASEAAVLLRGKHKPIFTPNVDCGDFVIIINGTLMAEKSDFAMQLAVKGMIPDTTLGRKQLTRCHIYKGADHKHEAQKPVAYEL